MTEEDIMVEDLDQKKFARCICLKDLDVETVIVGFPGMGLAGAIAVQHIAEKLELDTIGFIEGSVIPPVAVFLDGILRHPFRIMGKEGSKIAVFIGESAVSKEGAYYIANAVMEWVKQHGAKEIITLDGFAYMDKKDESKVYLVAEPDIKADGEKMDIPPLKSGFISGFAGAILNKTMLNDIDGYAFLVGTRPDLPDPGGAASLIKTLNKYKGTDISVEKLLEQSDSIKKKLQELAKQTQEMSEVRTDTSKKSTYYT